MCKVWRGWEGRPELLSGVVEKMMGPNPQGGIQWDQSVFMDSDKMWQLRKA